MPNVFEQFVSQPPSGGNVFEQFVKPVADNEDQVSRRAAQEKGGVQRAKKAATTDNLATGLLEEIAAMGSGMAAKPFSESYGMATIPFDYIARKLGAEPGSTPQETQQAIQRALTYEPTTEANKTVQKFNPMRWIAKGLEKGGSAAESAYLAAGDPTEPGSTQDDIKRGVGRGINETIQQAPNLLAGMVPKTVRALGEPVERAGERVMQSALKPTLKARSDRMPGAGMTKSDSAIETMFKEKLNVSEGGVDALTKKVDRLVDDVGTITHGSRKVLDRDRIAFNVYEDVRSEIRKANPHPQDALAVVDKLEQDFLDAQPRWIPLGAAQDMKQGIYKQLSETYGTGKPITADDMVGRRLAREFKDEIVRREPTVGPKNAELSPLINALKIASRRVSAEGNNSVVGGLAPLASHPAGFVAMLANHWGVSKSVAARILNSLGESMQGVGDSALPFASGVTMGADEPQSLRQLSKR